MTSLPDPIEDIAGYPVHFVTDVHALGIAAERWRSLPAIGIDTEFERSRTFFARPGLIQVFDGEAIWLIDPITCADHTPLAAVLAAPTPLKLIHSGSEDFELLTLLCKVTLRGFIDTQIAAGLAGLKAAISYRDLVETVCGVTLDKGETRSDWMRRPLSTRQLHYAALDVVYLLSIHDWLDERLEAAGRSNWVIEDTQRLVESAASGADLERMFREFKLAWKLDAPERAALKALIEWRERHAALRDVPRRRVLEDDQLLDLARQRPGNVDAIGQTIKLVPRKLDDVGPGILDAIGAAETHPPPPAPPPPLDANDRKRLKMLKQIVEAAAATLEIEPTLLASRRDLVALMGNAALPPRYEGWRRAIVGDQLIAALARA